MKSCCSFCLRDHSIPIRKLFVLQKIFRLKPLRGIASNEKSDFQFFTLQFDSFQVWPAIYIFLRSEGVWFWRGGSSSARIGAPVIMQSTNVAEKGQGRKVHEKKHVSNTWEAYVPVHHICGGRWLGWKYGCLYGNLPLRVRVWYCIDRRKVLITKEKSVSMSKARK